MDEDDGYQDGWDDGFQDGLNEGYEEGREEFEDDRDLWHSRAKLLAGMLYHVYNGGQLDRAATITAIAACGELKGDE